MEELIENLSPYLKKFGPLVMGGIIGAIIHRLRTQMSLIQFLASIIISMFVSLSVGLVCQDFFELEETVIFVICGVSGVFSKAILDEIEEIIKSVSGIIKSRYGKGEVEVFPSSEIEEHEHI